MNPDFPSCRITYWPRTLDLQWLSGRSVVEWVGRLTGPTRAPSKRQRRPDRGRGLDFRPRQRTVTVPMTKLRGLFPTILRARDSVALPKIPSHQIGFVPHRPYKPTRNTLTIRFHGQCGEQRLAVQMSLSMFSANRVRARVLL